MAFTYDLESTDPGLAQVALLRLLLNDVDEATAVFTDAEITAFFAMEGGQVKLAAAQAIDTNADDQALAAKVLKTQDLTTDGAKLADALHKRADSLRKQHAADLESDDAGYFGVIDIDGAGFPHPELTQHPSC